VWILIYKVWKFGSNPYYHRWNTAFFSRGLFFIGAPCMRLHLCQYFFKHLNQYVPIFGAFQCHFVVAKSIWNICILLKYLNISIFATRYLNPNPSSTTTLRSYELSVWFQSQNLFLSNSAMHVLTMALTVGVASR